MSTASLPNDEAGEDRVDDFGDSMQAMMRTRPPRAVRIGADHTK